MAYGWASEIRNNHKKDGWKYLNDISTILGRGSQRFQRAAARQRFWFNPPSCDHYNHPEAFAQLGWPEMDQQTIHLECPRWKPPYIM